MLEVVSSFYDENQNAENYALLPVEPVGTTGYLSTRDLLDLVKKHLGVQFNRASTLDYGCGVGRSTRYLKHHLSLQQVWGVDINAKMMQLAKQHDPAGNYQCIESAKTPFQDNTFEFVYSSFVIVEIATKAEIAKVFAEIYRVLSMGGTFILVTAAEQFFNPQNHWITYNQRYPENENLKSGSQTKFDIIGTDLVLRDYYWTQTDITELAEAAGFKIAEIHHPLGQEEDNVAWLSESTVAPFAIYVLKKGY